MSTEPDPAPAPDSVPPPAPGPQPGPPDLKRGSQRGAEEQKGEGASWAGGIIAVLLAVGGGLFAFFEKRDERPVPPIVMPKLDLDRGAKRAGDEQVRQTIRTGVALAKKAESREDAETLVTLLADTERLAKVAAPELLPEVQQARRDLEQRLQQDRFPRPSAPRAKADPLPVAPPPRAVTR